MFFIQNCHFYFGNFFIGPKRKLFWETTVSTFSTSLCLLLFPNSFYKKNTWCWGKDNLTYLCSLNRHIRNYFQEELAFLHSCCSQASHSALQLYHSGFSTEFFLIFKRDISLKKKITPWFLTAALPGLPLLFYGHPSSSHWMLMTEC